MSYRGIQSSSFCYLACNVLNSQGILRLSPCWPKALETAKGDMMTALGQVEIAAPQSVANGQSQADLPQSLIDGAVLLLQGGLPTRRNNAADRNVLWQRTGVTCPMFCTRWNVSVAHCFLVVRRRRRGCGDVGNGLCFPHLHTPLLSLSGSSAVPGGGSPMTSADARCYMRRATFR